MELSNDSSSCRDDLLKIIDKLIESVENTGQPLPMVTAMINVTMYRGKIDNFRALIRTKGYAGFERRSIS